MVILVLFCGKLGINIFPLDRKCSLTFFFLLSYENEKAAILAKIFKPLALEMDI